MRSQGLDAEMKSALLNLKYDLYPSRERLHRLQKVNSSKCVQCTGRDTHGHFLVCPAYTAVVSPLTSVLRILSNGSPLENVINCDIQCSEAESFGTVWLLANITLYIWDCVRQNREPTQMNIRGILRAKLEILGNVAHFSDKYNVLAPHMLSKIE